MPIEVTVWRRWLLVLIPVGILLVAVALIVPAILHAREAARRTQSKNNLRQFGLAFANYDDSHRSLPSGGTFDSNGRGFHGWPTLVLPYMEASPLYNWIDHSQPWDASFNAGFFRTRLVWAFNPSVRDDTPPEAYPVIHYSANSNLFGVNSSVRLSDVMNASDTFLAGE